VGGKSRALALGWFIAAAGGCLVDEGDPCGTGGFVVAGDRACVCPAGSVPVAGRCQPCAEHELASGSACVCEEGYVRDATRRCALVSASPTPDAGGGGGELVGAACTSSTGCAAGALCDVYGSGRCEPAPAGLGMACSAAEDCASSEATYCELFSSRTCQIQGCAGRAGSCPGDLACCDYSILGTSLCIPADRLESGQCPAPGQLIERQAP
jgi:hypothetical protein